MTRETKTIIKLNQFTTEYLALEREKEQYYLSHTNDLSRTTIHTLFLMQERIDTVVRQIIKLVDKLNRNDINFDNEVATLIFNYYEPQIRRGLSDLF